MWWLDQTDCAGEGGEEAFEILGMDDAWEVRGVACGVVGEYPAKGEAFASYPLP